jgi:ribosomal protein S5
MLGVDDVLRDILGEDSATNIADAVVEALPGKELP